MTVTSTTGASGNPDNLVERDGPTLPDAAQQQQPPPRATAERGSILAGLNRVTKLPNWLNFWVPLTASGLSLIVALYTLLVSTQDPELLLILPNQIHFSEELNIGNDYHPNAVYIQPSFVSTGNNDRTELIRSLSLLIEPITGGQPLTLAWREQGKWDLAENLTGLTRVYKYSADAAPMLVSPNQAQQPLSVFAVTVPWTLQPDTAYRLTLTANRAVASTPLIGKAEMRIPTAVIDRMKQQTINTILTVPIEPGLGE